ncbi:MAG: GGDEF domain-containing protein [Blautia marasmi]
MARVEQYIRQGQNPAAMLLIDVDNFKSINDTYGHLFGDRVLTETAGSLRTIFRREDIVARIGGDEFVVFMTNLQKSDFIAGKVEAIRKIFDHYTTGRPPAVLAAALESACFRDTARTLCPCLQRRMQPCTRQRKTAKGGTAFMGREGEHAKDRQRMRECRLSAGIGPDGEKSLERELAHKEMVYRTALKKSRINVWEYDIRSRTLTLTEGAQENHGFGQMDNAPQTLLEKGYIHPRSRQDLLDLYSRLEQGQSHVQADILTRSADGSYWWWEQVSYTMLYDEKGTLLCGCRRRGYHKTKRRR